MQPARDKTQRLSAISRTTPVPSAAFAMPFEPGQIIGGKYKVLKLIGMGGVAFVVSARHVALDEVVALKFLRPEFTTHPEAVRRFTIEGRANFKIQSEHVVRVLDVDALPDGTPFIVMELLDGTDLGRVLETRGALPVELAVAYVLQACEGLATAHAAYVVHRDIKPENLFLTKNEQGAQRIKLLDFGISKVALTDPAISNGDASGTSGTAPALRGGASIEQSSPAHTQSTSILGSPPYMSPEQVRASSETDSRTDIWSLGCVLYELLTYSAPFERPSVAETCAAILTDTPPSLRSLCPTAPPGLEAIVMRCLDKNPNARFQDVGQLAQALVPFTRPAPALGTGLVATLHDEVVASSSVPSGGLASGDQELSALMAFRDSGRATRVQRTLIASAIALVLAGAYVTMRISNAASPLAPASGSTTALATPEQHIATPAPVVTSAIVDAPAAAAAVAPALALEAEAPAADAPAVAAAPDTSIAAPPKPRVRVRSTKPKPKSTEPDVGF